MIDRVIHYCWFGGDLPSEKKERIGRWREACPGYEIVAWTDDTYRFDGCEYVDQARKNRKWAFASDYVRVDVLNRFGGIYLDTDIEILKPFDDLLSLEAFLGFENDRQISMSTLGFRPRNWFLQKMIDYYHATRFELPSGYLDLTPCVQPATTMLLDAGLRKDDANKVSDVRDIRVFPKEYFVGKDYSTEKVYANSNTYTLHLFEASWMNEDRKRYEARVKRLKKLLGKRLGRSVIQVLNMEPPKESRSNLR